MSHLEQMIERHVREYESRLKHLDELAERAKAVEHPQVHKELDELLKQRDELAVNLDEMKLRSVEDWAEEELAQAGPMGVWDVLAQKLEQLVERFER